MKVFSRIFIIIFSIILLFSCSEGFYTLFDNIVNDNRITDNQLENDLSVMGMTKLGGLGGTYYIACGDLRSRPEAGVDWARTTLALGIHNTIAANVTNTLLYVGVITDTDANQLGQLWSYNGTTATQISVTDLNYVVKLRNTNGNVYASIKKTDINRTFSLYNVTTSTEVGWVGTLGLTVPISDFVDFGGLFIVAGSSVYNSSGTDIAPSSSNTYVGITDDSTHLYLSTANGIIYQSTVANPTGPSDWTASSTFTYEKGGNTYYVRFTVFSDVITDRMWVGTRGTGFYEIDTTIFGITRFGDASKDDLYNGAIENFYIDTDVATPRVFFCTMKAGLWSNTYSGGWGEWTRE